MKLPSRGLPVTVALAAAVAACGSRSGLDLGASLGGEGGAATTGPDTTSGSPSTATTSSPVTTTTTTTGDPPLVACDELAVDTPYAQLGAGAGFYQLSPVLVPTSADGARITLVSAMHPFDGPPDQPREIRHTSFTGWNDWTPGAALAPTYVAAQIGGESFAAAPSDGDLLALAFVTSLGGDEPNIHFSPKFVPESDDVPFTPLADAGAHRALAVASAPYGHLIATEEVVIGANGAEHRLHLGTSNGGGEVDLVLAGCASDPVEAAITRSGDNVYAALLSDTPYSQPACGDDAPSPPSSSWAPGRKAMRPISTPVRISRASDRSPTWPWRRAAAGRGSSTGAGSTRAGTSACRRCGRTSCSAPGPRSRRRPATSMAGLPSSDAPIPARSSTGAPSSRGPKGSSWGR